MKAGSAREVGYSEGGRGRERHGRSVTGREKSERGSYGKREGDVVWSIPGLITGGT
jgi:hypothetical protein